MASKFHSEVHRREEVTFLKLGGVIDEDNELGVLAEQMGPGTLVIDLSEIERINSCGVRDWVNWLGRVEKGGGKVVLVECSPSIVAQVNLVNNFTGSGQVKSFYAPYFCPSCDREKVLLIETRDAVGQADFRAPTCRCDECDGPMDFDDMEDSYFAFLANSAKIMTDSRVDEVIIEFTPSDGAGPKLRARTAAGLTPASAAAPSVAVGSLPSVPALPALPALRKGAEAYTAVTTGRHLFSPTPPTMRAASGSAAAGGAAAPSAMSRVTPAFPIAAATMASAARAPATAAPAPSRGWMVVVGLLVVAALGLVVYLILGGPPGGASAGPPPAGVR